MKVEKKICGYLPNGKKIKLYTLKAGDLKFSITNIGAAWTSLIVPSHSGKDDVLLGYSSMDGFINNVPYFGVTVGRFANRIKNASFDLNGKTYNLEANDGKNSLHSGSMGFAKRHWKSEAYEENEGVFVRFELDSPDGDCGFPGNMKAVVSYGLTKSNEIIADYRAKTDKPCPVNFTNHAYFNLEGEGKGSVLSHEFLLHCSSYVEVDKHCIPTGKIQPVQGTYFDLKKRRKINKDYDHCFVVDGESEKLRPCAEVYEPKTGRFMKIFTTQPGVQFYTGNHLDLPGKSGSRYTKHSGFCLETQHFPDTPNHDNFPSCITIPGKDYHQKAVFAFSF
ncbi:MAG: galactose mutarotase [Treponema sp.]|nr:galactose mutarotase [Treponema sp.]